MPYALHQIGGIIRGRPVNAQAPPPRPPPPALSSGNGPRPAPCWTSGNVTHRRQPGPAAPLRRRRNVCRAPARSCHAASPPPQDNPKAVTQTSRRRTGPRHASRPNACAAGIRSFFASAAVSRISSRVTENGEHGRQRHLDHRIVRCVMMRRDDPLAVVKDCVMRLHHAVRRQPAILLRQVHRAAVQRQAYAKRLGLLRLNVHRVFKPARKHVMMIGCAGDAGHHQFSQRQPGRKPERRPASAAPRPDRALAARETAPC